MINISTSNIITLKCEKLKQNRQRKNKTLQNKQKKKKSQGPIMPWIKRLLKNTEVSALREEGLDCLAKQEVNR